MTDLFAVHNTFAPALLETLIHSVWMGGILYLLLRFYLDLASGQTAASRYRAAVATLVIQVLLTAAVLVSVYRPLPASTAFTGWIRFVGDMTGASRGTSQIAGPIGSSENSGAMHPSDMVLLIYVSGVVFFFFRMIIVSTLIRKRIGMAFDAAPKYIHLMERIKDKIGIRRRIRLVISDHMHSPALYGFFRPVVIVPAGMLTHLPFAQVEVILLHELFHLKKADFLVNLFQQVVEALLFFNPFTWMISGLIREEREQRVDDSVTDHCNSATYAKALFNLSLLHNKSTVATMAATGGGQKLLLRRIQRILKVNHMKKSLKTRLYLSAIVAVGAILVLSLSGFSSPLLHIDRQQTKAVQSMHVSPADGLAEQRLPGMSENSQSGTLQTSNQTALANHAYPGGPLSFAADTNETSLFLFTDQDTLTEKERKELMDALRRAREELESIDLDEEMARLEEERKRVMTELPALLKEEQLRIQEELGKIDQEMIRKQIEKARQELDSARQQIDIDAMQQKIEQNRQKLETQIRSGELDEKAREAMENSLEALKEIDFDEIISNMEEAINGLDLHIEFNPELKTTIDFDSIMISVQKNLQEIDIEKIKKDIDRSVKKIDRQMEELKGSNTDKN